MILKEWSGFAGHPFFKKQSEWVSLTVVVFEEYAVLPR